MRLTARQCGEPTPRVARDEPPDDHALSCARARSFRPLWALEELQLPCELKMLPFPPRVLAKDYPAINQFGTIPLLIDGDTRMTESAAIAHIS